VRTLLVSYDLARPGDEYPRLLAYLRAHAGTKPLGTTWVIRTPHTPRRVRDDIHELTDEGDEVLVIDVTGSSWATTFEDCTTEWMQARMLSRR
jgi:hypothetical protein